MLKHPRIHRNTINIGDFLQVDTFPSGIASGFPLFWKDSVTFIPKTRVNGIAPGIWTRTGLYPMGHALPMSSGNDQPTVSVLCCVGNEDHMYGGVCEMPAYYVTNSISPMNLTGFDPTDDLTSPEATIYAKIDLRSLPMPVDDPGIARVGDRLYLFGGTLANGSETSSTNAIQSAPIIDGQIGKWVIEKGQLPGYLAGAQVFCHGDFIYLFGGVFGDGKTLSKSVWMTERRIRSEGEPWAWVKIGDLPFGLAGANLLLTPDHLYTVGGYIDESAVGILPGNSVIQRVAFKDLEGHSQLRTSMDDPIVPSQVWEVNATVPRMSPRCCSFFMDDKLYLVVKDLDDSDRNLLLQADLQLCGSVTQEELAQHPVFCQEEEVDRVTVGNPSAQVQSTEPDYKKLYLELSGAVWSACMDRIQKSIRSSMPIDDHVHKLLSLLQPKQ